MRLFSVFISVALLFSQDFKTHFEHTNGLETCHPDQLISYYQTLAKTYRQIYIEEVGKGDSGLPINSIIVSSDGISSPEKLKNRAVIFVNNGIHSGEACGIDATQMLVRDLAKKMKQGAYQNVVFVTIPVFNVGGHQQFHPYNRINQNGPKAMGFRANSKNYNLNRDFMKAETQNMRAFYKVFHRWNPHVFIDNHSTNGADYQYKLTYIINETEDVTPPLRHYIRTTFQPFLENEMASRDFPISPYVNLKERDNVQGGINYFYATGRYSTGYASYFNTISILIETHMLKPFKARVESNNQFMWVALDKVNTDAKTIIEVKHKSNHVSKNILSYVLDWKVDSKETSLKFLAYESEKKQDPISQIAWVKYDRNKPKTLTIPYFKHFTANTEIRVPKSYLIPQSWYEIIERLEANGVNVQRLKSNQTFKVEQDRFSSITFNEMPFEGRFLPKEMTIEKETVSVQFKKGDALIELNQHMNRYILEALEPEGKDSFLRWGFFGTIFTQIEYFSPYLFVEKVDEIFKGNPQLKRQFEEKIKGDEAFAKNPYERLNYIYKRSKYAEKQYMVYPVARIMNGL